MFGGMAATSTPSATIPPSVASAVPSSTSFAFGSTSSGITATAAPATSAMPTASTSGFSFGASSLAPASPAINASTSGFSFGASSPASTPTKTDPPKAIGGFSFGAPSTPSATSSAASKPFFSFTKPAESDTKATPATTPTAEPKKTESSAFSFVKSETSAAATTTSTSSAAPTFSFNSPSTSKADQTPSLLTSKPADGGSAAKTFSFGTSTATTTPSTTTATSTAPKFSFGPSTSEKKADSATTTGAATTSASAAPAIPTIQVPAQPAQPSEFSFDKILEQMKLTSISMPQEIQFSLANAGMPGKMNGQQAMILQSTTFPFDKIEPITRHSELPDDARNQLDEVEKYMKSEMQVCDFLTKNKMVSKAEQIQRVKKDTESMTKQMEGLYSRLKGHLEIIEQLWNGVDYQHRNVVQASEIVDNYKKLNHQSRWAFGYGVHNNYFALLARNFEIRLERYRQNIVDIEATITSMSRHKNVGPKGMKI
ncbi:hypothetical protein BC943DRAFT_24417 [Umbelopsis sp. AD052]|nr:hypothetical protein BC943DRAFT_24417 [Umbelopsis sp. AD052]